MVGYWNSKWLERNLHSQWNLLLHIKSLVLSETLMGKVSFIQRCFYSEVKDWIYRNTCSLRVFFKNNNDKFSIFLRSLALPRPSAPVNDGGSLSAGSVGPPTGPAHHPSSSRRLQDCSHQVHGALCRQQTDYSHEPLTSLVGLSYFRNSRFSYIFLEISQLSRYVYTEEIHSHWEICNQAMFDSNNNFLGCTHCSVSALLFGKTRQEKSFYSYYNL